MRKIIIAIILLYLPVSCLATTGIFFSAAGGWARQMGLPTASHAKANKVKTKNFPVARFGVGYLHDIVPWFGFGMEVGYGSYSNSTYYLNDSQKIRVSSSTMEFMAVLMAHLSSFDLFTEVGGIRNTMTIRSSSRKDSETKIQPEIIVGAAYTPIQHFAFTVSYLRAFGQHVDSLTDKEWSASGLEAYLLGIRINFF